MEPIYDPQITPNTITLNKGNGTSSTTTGPGTSTSTSPSTTTSAGTSTTTTEPSSSSWQSAYAMMWGEDKEQKLSLLRYFRDEAVARDKVVRNYVSLLYQYTLQRSQGFSSSIPCYVLKPGSWLKPFSPVSSLFSKLKS